MDATGGGWYSAGGSGRSLYGGSENIHLAVPSSCPSSAPAAAPLPLIESPAPHSLYVHQTMSRSP